MKNEINPVSQRHPAWKNVLTLLALLAGLIFSTIEFFLFIYEIFAEKNNRYTGILIYIVYPVLMLGCLLTALFGIWLMRRQSRRGKVNLCHKLMRGLVDRGKYIKFALIILMMIGVMTAISSFGTYKAYEYSQSNQFCGLTCHSVMEPEFLAHQQSFHAKVQCAECHIGSTAAEHIQAKLAGVHQLFAMISGNIQKPLPVERVHQKRMAQSICGDCHWLDKEQENRVKEYTYYIMEDDQSEWKLQLQMNLKGEKGIHSHMGHNREVYLVSDEKDPGRILWVKSVDLKSGEEEVFVDEDSPYKNSSPPANKIKKMDCIDCHNRPAHPFEAPYRSLNKAMAEKRIDPAIEGFKEAALDALSAFYQTKEEGREKIRTALNKNFKDEASFDRENINKAIDETIGIFDNNFYPEMKVRWGVFPDHSGHLINKGCFRCHDGKKVSQAGKKLNKNCNSCHTITQQGKTGSLEMNLSGLEFKHPTDIDGEWKESMCSECHFGGNY